MEALASTFPNNLQILRGIASIALLNPDGSHQAELMLSPAAELRVSVSNETAQYISQESGTNEILDTTVISISRTGEIVVNNMSDEMKALFLVADATRFTQATSSVSDEITAYVYPNRGISLGGSSYNDGSGIFGVSAVTVSAYEGVHAATRANTTAYVVGDAVIPATPNLHWYMAVAAGTSSGTPPTYPTNGGTVVDGGVTWRDMGTIILVANTDYELDTTLARLNIPDTGSIGTNYAYFTSDQLELGHTYRLEVDYTRSAQSYAQVATKSQIALEGEFRFVEQNPKGTNSRWFAPLASLAPSGDMNLKSGQDYGAVTFALTFQKPPTKSALYINNIPAALT